MCYRCEVCEKVSAPREPRRVWVLYKFVQGFLGKMVKQIAREMSVCGDCLFGLNTGLSVQRLKAQAEEHKGEKEKSPPPVIIPYRPAEPATPPPPSLTDLFGSPMELKNGLPKVGKQKPVCDRCGKKYRNGQSIGSENGSDENNLCDKCLREMVSNHT